MSATEPLVKISNLEIDGIADETRTRIINNVSLELNRGEVMGLIGESGAGKSTLINDIFTLSWPVTSMGHKTEWDSTVPSRGSSISTRWWPLIKSPSGGLPGVIPRLTSRFLMRYANFSQCSQSLGHEAIHQADFLSTSKEGAVSPARETVSSKLRCTFSLTSM